MQGKCKYGDSCKHIHVDPPVITDPTVCKFFVTGTCMYNEKCTKKHDKKLQEKYQKDFREAF